MTYNQLKKEFEKKVEELQKNCPHKKSTWMEKWWAIGHSAGYKVKVCLCCNKILEENPTAEERKKTHEKEVKLLVEQIKKQEKRKS